MKRCVFVLLFAALSFLPLSRSSGRGGAEAGGAAAGAPGCCQGLVPVAFCAENVVCVTKKGKKFHRATCRVLKDSAVQKMSRAEAESKGYSPCKICKP